MAASHNYSICLLVLLITLSSISAAARPLPTPSPVLNTTSDLDDSIFDSIPAITSNPRRVSHNLRPRLQFDLQEAIGALLSFSSNSESYAIMASFIVSQQMGLVDIEGSVDWTVFAPSDHDIRQLTPEDFHSVLLRHSVPHGPLYLRNFRRMANGTLISSNTDGSRLHITKLDDRHGSKVVVNGVEITHPGMYSGSWLVVHGVRGIIPTLPPVEQQIEQSSIRQGRYHRHSDQ